MTTATPCVVVVPIDHTTAHDHVRFIYVYSSSFFNITKDLRCLFFFLILKPLNCVHEKLSKTALGK